MIPIIVSNIFDLSSLYANRISVFPYFPIFLMGK